MIEFLNSKSIGTNFVRIGLWDNAWDAATGVLRNAESDNDNFVSLDSRRFYIKVTDANAAAKNTAAVTVNWWTRRDRDNVDENLPSNAELTLTRVGATNDYISKAVMLVSDDDDYNQGTHSGLPGGKIRNKDESNHRLRKVTVDDQDRLDRHVCVEYKPSGQNNLVSKTATIFNRHQDERLRIIVNFYNIRQQDNGNPSTQTATLNTYKQVLQSIYARCGIFPEVKIQEFNPTLSTVGWQNYVQDGKDAGVDTALQVRTQNLPQIAPSPTQLELIQRYHLTRSEISVFFVDNIYDVVTNNNAGGESFFTAQTTITNNLEQASEQSTTQFEAKCLAKKLFPDAPQYSISPWTNPQLKQKLKDVFEQAKEAAENVDNLDNYLSQAQAFYNVLDAARSRVSNYPQEIKNAINAAFGAIPESPYQIQNNLKDLIEFARGCAFVVAENLVTKYAPVHEITHITTNLNNEADGHFDLEAANSDKPGFIDGKNLMNRYELYDGNGVNDPKRLWDKAFINTNRNINSGGMVIPAQITAISNSHFMIDY